MLIFGGFVDGGERTNDLWKYTFASTKWERLPTTTPCPSPRASHSALLRGQTEMYIFGGRDEDNEKLNDLWVFNLDTLRWTQVKPVNQPPTPRCGHSASMYGGGDMMMVFGGIYEVTKELNDLQAFEFKTRRWVPIFEEINPANVASPVRNNVASPDSTPF